MRSNASRAARCSASFLDRPSPDAVLPPARNTVAVNSLAWSGPPPRPGTRGPCRAPGRRSPAGWSCSRARPRRGRTRPSAARTAARSARAGPSSPRSRYTAPSTASSASARMLSCPCRRESSSPLPRRTRSPEPEVPGHVGQREHVDRGGPQLGQLTLRHVRERRVGEVRHDQPEHGVAQELQPLVRVGRALLERERSVAQRALAQLRVRKRRPSARSSARAGVDAATGAHAVTRPRSPVARRSTRSSPHTRCGSLGWWQCGHSLYVGGLAFQFARACHAASCLRLLGYRHQVSLPPRRWSKSVRSSLLIARRAFHSSSSASSPAHRGSMSGSCTALTEVPVAAAPAHSPGSRAGTAARTGSPADRVADHRLRVELSVGIQGTRPGPRAARREQLPDLDAEVVPNSFRHRAQRSDSGPRAGPLTRMPSTTLSSSSSPGDGRVLAQAGDLRRQTARGARRPAPLRRPG